MKILDNLTIDGNATADNLGGGSSNPNFIPSNASDFTSPNPSNANKIWEIQSDIDTGTSDIDFSTVEGITLYFNGGSLTGTGTIIPNNTKIKAVDNIKNYFSTGYTFSSGSWVGNINANWFGLVGDSSTDNRQALLNASHVVNSSGGICYLYNDTEGGIYEMTVVANAVANSDTPTNIIISSTARWEGIISSGKRPTVKMKPNSLSGGEMFETFNSYDGYFKNIKLEGERYEHTGLPTDERLHNFMIGRNTNNFTFENNESINSTADGISFISDMQFYNSHTTDDYTQGNIDVNDGSIVADTDYMYSDSLYPVTNSDFTARKKFTVVGGSYGTVITPRVYQAVYYDNTDTFIGKSEFLNWYDEAEIPTNCTQIRLVLPYYDSTTETVRVACSFVATGTKIWNNIFDYNERQCISNPGNLFSIKYNVFQNTGEKSPARAIDIEDLYQGNRNGEIAFNIFRNNHNGDIVAKAPEFINIHDNVFDVNDRFAFTDGATVSTNGTGLQTSNMFNSTTDRNILKNRSLSVGNGNSASGNTLYLGKLQINNAESKVIGGNYYDIQVLTPTTWSEGNAYLKNASLFYDRPLLNSVFTSKGSLAIENTVIDFGNISFSGTIPINQMYSLTVDGSQPVNGYIDGLTIKNLEVNDSNKWQRAFEWYAQPISNFKSTVPLTIRYGKQKNLVYKNLEVKGRLNLVLDQFSDDGSLTTDITIDNLYLDSDHVNYTQFTSSVLMTSDVDINLTIKNSTIYLTTGISKLFDFNHSGYTKFENCKFITPDTFSETATGFIFNNCTFDEGGGTITMSGATINDFGSSSSTVDVVSNVASGVILGRTTAGSGDSEELTAEQVRTLLNVDESSSSPELTTITKYTDEASLPSITGNEIDVYAYVTSDSDLSKRGLYVINNGAWILLYHFENLNMPVKKVSINEIDLSQPVSTSTTDATEEGIINGYQFNLSADGVSVSASKYISNFIPVRYGDRLLRQDSDRFWFFDEDKQPIPYSSGIVPYNFVNTININNKAIHYVRVSSDIADKGVKDMVIKLQNSTGGANPTGWVDFHGASDNYQRDNDKYTYEKEGVIYRNYTNNLFDIKKAECFHSYSSTGVESTSYASTGFIPCEAGIPYVYNGSGNTNISFWDENFGFISGTINSGAIAPVGAKYVNFQLSRTTTNWSTINVVQNFDSEDTIFKVIDTEVLNRNTETPLTVCLMGDSIGTEDGTYATTSAFASILRHTLNIEIFHNISVSGRSMAQYRTNFDNGAYDTPIADVYFIELGTNDFGYNVVIGTNVDTSSTDSFFGAMDAIRDGILALNANAKIIFFTPIPRSTQYNPNALSNTLEDYRNAIINFCRINDYPYLDLFGCGLETSNSNLMLDGTHPNNIGHQLILFPEILPFIDKEIRRN